MLSGTPTASPEPQGRQWSSSSARRPRSCSSRSPFPTTATELLVHVRDFTKGHPSIAANNHPVRHGPVVGVHNGRILNDDELLAEHSCARAEPEMTVDSEAVFAVAAHSAQRREGLRGAPRHDGCGLARRAPAGGAPPRRGVGRPLWLGECRDGLVFASTEHALEVVERYCASKLREAAGRRRDGSRRPPRIGRAPRSASARRDYAEDDPLPESRGLAASATSACSRLATIAAAL